MKYHILKITAYSNEAIHWTVLLHLMVDMKNILKS